MRKTALFAGIVALSTSAFAADSQLLNLVMPEAKVIAGINVAAAKASPLGQYMLAHVASSDRGLDSFIAQTGFDPRLDVTEILAASAGGGKQGLVLAKGTFNVGKISDAAAQQTGHAVQQYGGATLISSGSTTNQQAVAFISGSVAVAGDLASVKAAIDRSQATNSIDPALATRVQMLSTTKDAWSVALASISALIPQIGGTTLQGPSAGAFQLVKDIQESSGGLKFGANVEVTAQAVTSDPKNATALGDLVKMVASLSAMATAGKDPHAAQAAALLQQVQVTTNGNTVDLALTVPEAQVENLLTPAVNTKL